MKLKFWPARAGQPRAPLSGAALLVALVAGHAAVDLNQGALPALLPFLKQSMNLSYTQSAAILMVMTFSSSIIQPLFGHFSDRFSGRQPAKQARRCGLGAILPAGSHLLAAGVLLGGVGFACLGLATSYWQVLLIVFISGLGVAAYHPQGAKDALTSSPKKVVAMSWFMLGGNMGFALGPLAVMACLSLGGQRGILLFALPALLVGLLLVRLLAKDMPTSALSPASTWPVGQRARPMALLLASVICRSSVQVGFLVFMPFYLTEYLGWSKIAVAPMLSFYLLAGSLGTIVGGQIGQKMGPRRFFLISILLVAPLNLLFLQVQSSLWLYVILGLSAACLMATWSSMVVMAQDIMPERSGMAAALMVGFSIGGGGLCATLLGLMADHISVLSVMWFMALLPLISAGLAFLVTPRREAAD